MEAQNQYLITESKTICFRNNAMEKSANEEEELELVDGGGNRVKVRDTSDFLPPDFPLNSNNVANPSTPPPCPPPLPPRVAQTQHLIVQRPHFRDVRILRAQQKLAASLSTVPNRKIQTTNATSKGASFFAGFEQPPKEAANFQKWRQKILAVNTALKFASPGENINKTTIKTEQNNNEKIIRSSEGQTTSIATNQPTVGPQIQRNGTSAASNRWNRALKALKFRVPSSSMVTRSHSNQPSNAAKQNRLLDNLTMEQFLLRASVER